MATKEQNKQNVHSGHRLRMKKRFLTEGLDGFAPHEIIELLLYFGVPVKDTNELAHELLDRFGSFAGVIEAPFEDLVQVKGISDHTATLICLCRELCRKYYEAKFSLSTVMGSIEDMGAYIMPKFFGRRTEAVVLLSMDNRRKVLNCSVVYEGSVSATEVNIRLLLQQALRDNATMAVIAHNHPNGHAVPSESDIRTTEVVRRALKVAGVQLVDHLIFSEDDYISLRQSAHFTHLFER